MEKTKTGAHFKETLLQMAVAVLPRVTEALVAFLEKVLQEKTHAAQMDQAAKANMVAKHANESDQKELKNITR